MSSTNDQQLLKEMRVSHWENHCVFVFFFSHYVCCQALVAAFFHITVEISHWSHCCPYSLFNHQLNQSIILIHIWVCIETEHLCWVASIQSPIAWSQLQVSSHQNSSAQTQNRTTWGKQTVLAHWWQRTAQGTWRPQHPRACCNTSLSSLLCKN